MLWSAPYCIGWTTECKYFTLKSSYDKTTESVGMGCLQKDCFETTWLVKKTMSVMHFQCKSMGQEYKRCCIDFQHNHISENTIFIDSSPNIFPF